jgi:ATP-dependent metalloprotease
MLTEYGMSNSLGPVEYADRYENLSSETKSIIEKEVQANLKASYEDVRKILTDNRQKLELLAKALVEYETLDKAEVEKVIRGEALPGRPRALPKGPISLPLEENAPHGGGLEGVPQPQPPESSARPPTSVHDVND